MTLTAMAKPRLKLAAMAKPLVERIQREMYIVVFI